MNRRKTITVVFVSLFIVILILVLGILLNPKNYESPREYFSVREKPTKIYLDFKEGGNLGYHSKVQDGIKVITDEEDINLFWQELQSLDFDLWAPHRGNRAYDVYINFGDYEEKKMECKNEPY